MAAYLNDSEARSSVTDEPPRPFLQSTLDLYKSRCLNLEEELAQQQTAASQQQLQVAALETKVQLLLECYREVDDELFNHRQACSSRIVKDRDGLPPSYVRPVQRCADLQAQLQEKRNSLSGGRKETGQRGQGQRSVLSQATNEGMNNYSESESHDERDNEDSDDGGEGVLEVQGDVARLLKNACRQLAEAREVGGKLLQELHQSSSFLK